MKKIKNGNISMKTDPFNKKATMSKTNHTELGNGGINRGQKEELRIMKTEKRKALYLNTTQLEKLLLKENISMVKEKEFGSMK